MDYTGMDSDRMFGAGDGVTLLDQIKADRMGGLWIVNPDMKSVVTYDDGDIVVHDEYGVMDARELRRIGRVPSMEAALLAAGELLEFADLVHGSFGGGRIITFSDADIEQCQNAIASFRSAIEVK